MSPSGPDGRRAAPSPDEALERVWSHCVGEDWTGWDPYDGLMTRRWPATLLTRSRTGRLVLIQGLKRSPINLRPLLAVPKLQNPKAMALGLSTAARLTAVASWTDRVQPEMPRLAARLLEQQVATQSGGGWGYPFDWQSRAFFVPAFSPTIVCTGFVVRALDEAFDALPAALQDDARSALEKAADFVRRDLKRLDAADGFCWSYSQFDQSRVVNATLLGAETLARTAARVRRLDLLDEARPTIVWALNRQREDGGWDYGEGAHHAWEDAFHTGFNLLSLFALRKAATRLGVEPELLCPIERIRLGAAYYATHFFDADGRPWYYRRSVWPVDAHAAAVAIITLLALRNLDAGCAPLARKVLDWSLTNLWRQDGLFAFQIQPYFRNSIVYLRWSQCWMLRALAEWRAVRTR